MLLGPALAVVSLSLTEASEADVRSVPGSDELAFDLSTTPASSLAFRFERSALTVGYAATVGWLDFTRDGQLVVLHSAGGSYSWWTRRLRLSLGVRGSLGRQSFLAAARQTGAPATTNAPGDGGNGPDVGDMEPMAAPSDNLFVARREVVETAAVSVALDGFYLLSRRWQASLGVSYEVAGGIHDSEPFLPLRRGPSASASLTYAASRRDDLVSSVSASRIDVPSRSSRFVTVGVLETWGHRFAEHTTGTIGAGASYLRSRASRQAPNEHALLGAGLASIAQGFLLEGGANLDLGAGASLSTGYNPVLGTVSQQAGGVGTVTWSKDEVSVAADGRVSQTLPISAPEAAFGYGTSLTVTYRPLDLLQLSAGGSWSRQILPNDLDFPGVRSDSWRAFIGVGLSAPPITF